MKSLVLIAMALIIIPVDLAFGTTFSMRDALSIFVLGVTIFAMVALKQTSRHRRGSW